MKDQARLQNRHLENRNRIVQAAAELIRNEGVNGISVRSVCSKASISTGSFYYYFRNKDDLLLSFLVESSFEKFELNTPVYDIGNRISELYSILIKKYISYGKEFMRSFYTPSNKTLAAYMSIQNGKFLPNTIMARCENEINNAQKLNIISNNINSHRLSYDICTIIKGIIFEYSLSEEEFNVVSYSNRIINNYIGPFLNKENNNSGIY